MQGILLVRDLTEEEREELKEMAKGNYWASNLINDTFKVYTKSSLYHELAFDEKLARYERLMLENLSAGANFNTVEAMEIECLAIAESFSSLYESFITDFHA